MKVPEHGPIDTDIKLDPLPKAELYNMIGEPVFVTSPYHTAMWRVIQSIHIDIDGVNIMFTDKVMEKLENIHCYSERVEEKFDEPSYTDEEVADLLHRLKMGRL